MKSIFMCIMFCFTIMSYAGMTEDFTADYVKKCKGSADNATTVMVDIVRDKLKNIHCGKEVQANLANCECDELLLIYDTAKSGIKLESR